MVKVLAVMLVEQYRDSWQVHIVIPEVVYKWAKENIAVIVVICITQKNFKAHFLRMTNRLHIAEIVAST
jgi:hypothetical protein